MVNKPLLRPYFSWGVPEPWGPRLTGHDQLQVGPTGSMEVWPNLGCSFSHVSRYLALKKRRGNHRGAHGDEDGCLGPSSYPVEQ